MTGRDLRPHRQSQRPRCPAAERDGQSDSRISRRTRPTTPARRSRRIRRRPSTASSPKGATIPNSDWKFCGRRQPSRRQRPVTTLPVRLCLKDGFDPAKLYQLVYTVERSVRARRRHRRVPRRRVVLPVCGRGRFRYANPLAGTIKKAIIRGSSQSGNFTRHFIHLGMNQDEAGRIVHEGAWPLIAGRRVANNSRWGQPDGVLELYQMGSEGPQWWHCVPGPRPRPATRAAYSTAATLHRHVSEDHRDVRRRRGVRAEDDDLLGRHRSRRTTFPLPDNVRRYYLPSSTHGGGGGGFNEAIRQRRRELPR